MLRPLGAPLPFVTGIGTQEGVRQRRARNGWADVSALGVRHGSRDAGQLRPLKLGLIKLQAQAAVSICY